VASTDLPNRPMEERIVPDVVDADMPTIELDPGHLRWFIPSYLGIIFEAAIPGLLFRPQRDVDPLAEGRQEPPGVVRNTGLGRR
jgi:hypothetical protein